MKKSNILVVFILLVCGLAAFMGQANSQGTPEAHNEHNLEDFWEYTVQTHSYVCKSAKFKKGRVVGTMHLRFGVIVLIDTMTRETVTLRAECEVQTAPTPNLK